MEFADAFPAFRGGLVGKGDGEDVARATPLRSRYAMRCVMTQVLPVPAPARISTRPWMVSTAWRCGGLSVLRSNIGRGVYLRASERKPIAARGGPENPECGAGSGDVRWICSRNASTEGNFCSARSLSAK